MFRITSFYLFRLAAPAGQETTHYKKAVNEHRLKPVPPCIDNRVAQAFACAIGSPASQHRSFRGGNSK